MSLSRLFNLLLSLHCCYILLGLSHESLFFLCLAGAMLTWLALERDAAVAEAGTGTAADASRESRLALQWIFYSLVSYFGPGIVPLPYSTERFSILFFLKWSY